MRKKLISGFLSCLLLASLCVASFAADSPQLTVKGTYQADGSTPVYSFSYGWDTNMEFVYSAGSSGTWNPNTHSYSGDGSSAGWSLKSGTSNEIEVINHSNAAIKVALTFEADSAHSDVTGGFDTPSFTIDSAVGTEYDSAPSKVAKFGITGGALSDGDSGVTLGTITLNVSAA